MSKHTIAFYALFALILAIVVTVLFNTCGNPSTYLNEALRSLDSAQRRLDTALVKIDDSKKIIDSMRFDLSDFQKKVTDISTDVERLNKRSQVNAEQFQLSMNRLRNDNQRVIKQLKVRHDTLPEIKILSR